MTVYGNAGVLFNITEEADTTTGTVIQVQEVPVAIGTLDIDEDDLVFSVDGSVGTTVFTFNLNAIDNQSGTGYSTQVVRNNDGDLSYLKALVIYNSHASNNLILGSAASANLFTWHSATDSIIIAPGQAQTFIYSSAISVVAAGSFKLTGSAASTTFQMWILGTD